MKGRSVSVGGKIIKEGGGEIERRTKEGTREEEKGDGLIHQDSTQIVACLSAGRRRGIDGGSNDHSQYECVTASVVLLSA